MRGFHFFKLSTRNPYLDFRSERGNRNETPQRPNRLSRASRTTVNINNPRATRPAPTNFAAHRSYTLSNAPISADGFLTAHDGPDTRLAPSFNLNQRLFSSRR